MLAGFSIKLSAGSSRVWWPAPVLHSLLGSGIDLSAVGLAEDLGHDRSSACFSLMKMTRPDEQEVCRSWPLMTRKYFQADLGVEDRYLLNGKIIFNMDLEMFQSPPSSSCLPKLKSVTQRSGTLSSEPNVRRPIRRSGARTNVSLYSTVERTLPFIPPVPYDWARTPRIIHPEAIMA